MAKTIFTIGRNTKIQVCPSHTCDYVLPVDVTFTVATGGAIVGATSIPITAAPNLTTIVAPVWLLFTNPTTGAEASVKVTADIDPGDTSLTVTALKKAVPVGATSEYPVRLSARSSANLSTQMENAEIENLDNDGWKEFIQTANGYNLDLQGSFLPLDPGYQTCLYAILNYESVYCKLTLPKPVCPNDTSYTHGGIWEGYWMPSEMPIEAGAKAVITGNITLMSQKEIVYTPAA